MSINLVVLRKLCEKSRCFPGKFTHLKQILHNHRSWRSRQISTLSSSSIMDTSYTHYASWTHLRGLAASYTHYASWTHHTHTMHHGHICVGHASYTHYASWTHHTHTMHYRHICASWTHHTHTVHYGHICVGHTAWAPKGRKRRSQGGPKSRRLEVGARRAP